MFTRSLYQTRDMIEQHRLLDEVADLVDAGVLRSTMTANLGHINAENLKNGACGRRERPRNWQDSAHRLLRDDI
jgi:hypothetical protein